MVGTQVDGQLEFRPLTAARVHDTSIEILLDTNEDWARGFKSGDPVFVTMSDTKENTWLSARGRGTTSADPAHIDQLWNAFAGAYFDEGRDTPGIAVMTIESDEGRYWSAPSGRIGSLISMARAKLGSAGDSGEHGPIDLQS